MSFLKKSGKGKVIQTLKLDLSSSDNERSDVLDELQRLKKEQDESTYSPGDRETLEQYERSQKSRTFHESSEDESDDDVSQKSTDISKDLKPMVADLQDLDRVPETTTYDPRGESVQNITEAVARMNRIRYVLAAFKERRNPNLTMEDYKLVLFDDLQKIYGLSEASCKIIGGILGLLGLIDFAEALDKPPVQTLRVNPLKMRRKDLAAILISKGAMVEPLNFSEHGLACYKSQIPLGATSEYLRGYYMLQDAASLLPVLALNPKPGEVILDAAAAPGGKTSHICALMKNQGVLMANDVNASRIKALQANLARMGCWNVIVTNTDTFGIKNGGFDRILLDAPCTGLGLMQKDVRSRASRDFKDLQKMQQLQRRLLDHCISLLKHTGNGPKRIVYSTCSISIAENEAVVDYVIKKRGDCKIVDTGLAEGLGMPGLIDWKEHSFMTSMKLARRFYPHVHNVIGFFVCAIEITDNITNKKQLNKK